MRCGNLFAPAALLFTLKAAVHVYGGGQLAHWHEHELRINEGNVDRLAPNGGEPLPHVARSPSVLVYGDPMLENQRPHGVAVVVHAARL